MEQLIDSQEKEQSLLAAAKQALSPEKYEEFVQNYVEKRAGLNKDDWAIHVPEFPQETVKYSDPRLSKCSPKEQKKFWKNLDETFSLTVIPDITLKTGKPQPFSKIYALMCDPAYATVDKIKRQALFSTSDGIRPIGDKGAMAWNGFQVIDLDLKNKELAQQLKTELFDGLCKEHWFLGVTVSSSGSGIHVWTKIAVRPDISFDQMQLLYALNFRHKYSSVYLIIEKLHKEMSSEDIISFMDFAMFKPQQGVFIPGQIPEVNTNFLDCELMFESVYDDKRAYSDYEWVTVPALLETFSKWEWFANHKKSESDIAYQQLTATGTYKLNGIKRHYKHEERWQLANTLCAIYGFDKGLEILRAIVTDDVPTQELRADMITARNYNKPISLKAVRTLNFVHGFNIKCEGQDTWIPKPAENFTQDTSQDIYDLYKEDSSNQITLSIKKDGYLSDIAEEIKANLGRMTLLEAGAGFGKTEMIKRLGGKVLLVLPFTSIIESKFFDSSEWECFFQNRSVKKEDLEKYDKLCMTADKFSQLKMMDVNFSYFDYVVIDESHLLFLSEYRPIMSMVVDNIAHSACKIILMTGTPSGETLFFPNIRHILVNREETRDKTFSVFFGNTRSDTRLQMADAMSNAIMEGKKVLFPTNAGSLQYKTLIADIDRFLFYKGFPRSIRSVYYKKANEGSPEMDKITFEKTIDNLDLVACTSYLSVGVDICDKMDFVIFFDKLIIAQDIEQYANRLRNNNLHINMYLPKTDDDGNAYEYDRVLPFSMKIDESELQLARDCVKMCNTSAIRARGEYKYNPLIHSVLKMNPYIMFSNNIGRYYIDETAFKLHTFENKYRYYASQLPVVKQAMERYGYTCTSTDEFAMSIDPNIMDEIEGLNKTVRKSKYEEDTIITMEFLKALNNDNIDWLIEAANGRFKLKKEKNLLKPFALEGDSLYLRSIEMFNKNMPIVKTLYKFYDFETILCIFDYCMSDKLYQINYSMLKRITKLISIEYNNRKGRVDVPILSFMERVKQWVEENSKRTKDEIVMFLRDCTLQYVKAAGEFLLGNVNLIEHTYEMIEELFKVLVTKTKAGKNKNNQSQFTITQNKLLWTEKTNYSQLYGNPNTKIFFLGDIIEAIKPEEPQEEVPEEPQELQMSTDILEGIDQSELDPSVVTSQFDYYTYESENTIIRDFYAKQLEDHNNSLMRKAEPESEPEEEPKNLLIGTRTLFDI